MLLALFVVPLCALGAEDELLFIGNPLQPNPVTLLAKQEHVLCAIFGKGVVTLNTKSGEIVHKTLDAPVTSIVAWPEKGWGVITGSVFYYWDGTKNNPVEVYRSKHKTLLAFADEKKTYLSDGAVIEYDNIAKKHVIDRFIHFNNRSLAVVGWWGESLLGSGNGVYSVDISGDKLSYKNLLGNYWASKALSINRNEFIVTGGGWPALIVSNPSAPKATLLFNGHSSDTDFDIDWEKGEYWIASRQVSESQWIGNIDLRSYPGKKGILLKNFEFQDFKVIGKNKYFATAHGIVELLEDGKVNIYTLPPLAEKLFEKAQQDLNQQYTLTSRETHDGIEWISGFYRGSRWRENNGSFLLKRISGNDWSMIDIPIAGVTDLVFDNNKIIIAGHDTFSYDAESEHVGGLGIFDIASSKFTLVTESPAAIESFDDGILKIISYINLYDGVCIAQVLSTYNMQKGAMITTKRQTVCDEDNRTDAPDFVHIFDAKIIARARVYFKEEQDSLESNIELGNISKIPLKTQVDFYPSQMVAYDNAPLDDPMSVMTKK